MLNVFASSTCLEAVTAPEPLTWSFPFILTVAEAQTYPGYMTIPRDACQIPQRSDTPRLGDPTPSSGDSDGPDSRAPGRRGAAVVILAPPRGGR
jgi:hypothetical protein